YDYVGKFSEGLASVKTDNNSKGFHIDHNGKPAYKERYDLVENFHEGLALARKDGEFFKIDHNGKRIEPSTKKS
ncbi:MAG TPA: WG repeat-containing protein, partial [Candidatus Parcubacteria bacterium]|nr:WG repeat-containing protein [Candidatus Parcubacteria bacterium]